ncbi:MAG: Rrf2 family transcriptional regulator [Akkermansia sp.]|nr:Rrf2 family transcriptional regulator [Akkermansia sp.]
MMRISTKGRYALRIMIDLANQNNEEPVSLRSVAERQNITLKYMEGIMTHLLRAQLVVSIRGKAGGYYLARPAEDYTIYEILKAAEGDLSTVHCLSTSTNLCPMSDMCTTLPLWVGLQNTIQKYLESYTLADLKGDTTTAQFCDN